MSETLLDRLKAYVKSGAFSSSSTDDAFISACLAESQALVNNYAGVTETTYEPFVIDYTDPVNHITEKYTFTMIGDIVRLEVTGGTGSTSLPVSLIPVAYRPAAWFDSGEIATTYNNGVLQSIDPYWDENPKGVLTALYPAGPSNLQPVTLSWATGEKVELSRDGDVVTAVVTPRKTAARMLPSPQPIPAGFGVSSGDAILTVTPPSAAPAWQLQVIEASGIMPFGLVGTVGPYLPSPAVFQWIADPLPAAITRPISSRVPLAVLERAYLECASELYQRRSAPQGVSQFASPDGGTVPVSVGRDPMSGARLILAPYLPGGFA